MTVCEKQAALHVFFCTQDGMETFDKGELQWNIYWMRLR